MEKKFINSPGQTILIIVAVIAVLIAVYYIYQKIVKAANPPTAPAPSATAATNNAAAGTTTTPATDTNEGEAIIIANNIVSLDSKSDIGRVFAQNVILDTCKKLNTASNAQLQLIASKLQANTGRPYVTIKQRVDWDLNGCRGDVKQEHEKLMIKLINLIG